jgi:hypothetical protein
MKLSLVKSRLFGRICYGYRRDKRGLVEIVPEEAEVVRAIFGLYKTGSSLEAIQTCLLNHKIPSPSGKSRWSRDVLNKLLNNGKYTKGIIGFEDYCDVYFLKSDNCRNPNQAKAGKANAKSNQGRTGMGICPYQREIYNACEQTVSD